MNVRTAVVLAAGEGTRLRPLTENRPKPMLSAGNRPILEHVLDALVDAGIERVVLVVGYRRTRVQEHFGPDYRDVPIEYVIQDKQLGSGHALLEARDATTGPLVVVNGDRVIDSGSVEEVIERFESGEDEPVMAVIEREDAHRYGGVRLAGGEITRLVEKPDPGAFRLINAGIYAFGDAIFDEIAATSRESGELALTDTIGRLMEEGRVAGVKIEGVWVDATYPWDLLEVTSEVLATGRVSEPPREDGVWVAESAAVHADATLRPPVAIGADCVVGPGSVIGPEVAVGESTTIGANVTLEGSVVDPDSRLDHGSTIVDAVFGQDVHLKADATIPGGPADVRVDQEVFEDQRLGAVLADRVGVGGGVTFQPGSLVGSGARIGDGAVVRGHVASGAEVVR
ncbi:nucleotidyl transferase [Halobacteriales archaeon SW_7_65_23]|nr:MAG: nucleotidyl transferase [Halobacteriales archaeon SW_7_65_23]